MSTFDTERCVNFRKAIESMPFEPGDFLFAPAGVKHRFVDFSDELALWVFFYGPEGGENKT